MRKQQCGTGGHYRNCYTYKFFKKRVEKFMSLVIGLEMITWEKAEIGGTSKGELNS